MVWRFGTKVLNHDNMCESFVVLRGHLFHRCTARIIFFSKNYLVDFMCGAGVFETKECFRILVGIIPIFPPPLSDVNITSGGGAWRPQELLIYESSRKQICFLFIAMFRQESA